MKFKYLSYKYFVSVVCFALVCLLLCSLSISTAMAQKKPTSLKLDVDADDKEICKSSSIKGSQFCDYYNSYNGKGATSDEKKQARNEMIQLVRGQADTYYKMRKDGRRTKIKWLQTLLDFLEVGAATAISIINGERAKTVVGAALNGFQGGRTSFNNNFKILQTQALINQMNIDRAKIMTEIIGNIDKPVSEYSWYAAKNDLRRYLLAGTFNNALDNLVESTGAAASSAERTLKTVEKRVIINEISEDDATRTDDSFKTLKRLEDNLAKTETKDKALDSLKKVVAELRKEETFKASLTDITDQSDGVMIVKAIRLLSRKLTIENNTVLIAKLETTIIEHGK